MTIESYELKLNLDKYLKLVKKENIFIAMNGKIVAELTNPYQVHVNTKNSLQDEAALLAKQNAEPINYDKLLG